MTLPLFTPMKQRSVAEQLVQEGLALQAKRQAEKAAERAAMSPEQLMKLERQIEALKERGSRGEDVRERLRELRRSHYDGNGADGG